MEALQGEITGF